MRHIKQLARALNIQKSLGTRTAAGYLRNRDYTLDQALVMLLGCHERKCK
jgi:hypothetical protein